MAQFKVQCNTESNMPVAVLQHTQSTAPTRQGSTNATSKYIIVLLLVVVLQHWPGPWGLALEWPLQALSENPQTEVASDKWRFDTSLLSCGTKHYEVVLFAENKNRRDRRDRGSRSVPYV